MNIPRYLCFMAGQLGLMMLLRYFFQWILAFADVGGGTAEDGSSIALFTAATVGAVLLGFRIFDGVTDPIAGMLGDGWVRKGRERRQLLWFVFFVPPVGMTLCFLPDGAMPLTLRWVLLCVGMFVFFVGYTFYAIPYWSLMDDYAGEDEGRRRALSNLLGLGMLLATAIGFVITPLLVDRFGYFQGAVMVAVPATVLMILPFFAQPASGPARTPSVKSESDPGLFESLTKALRHRKFLAVLLMFSGSQMSLTIMTSAAFFIVKFLLESATPEKDVTNVLAPFLGGAIPFFIFVPWISRRFGWERSVVAASIALGVIYGGTGFLGRAIIGTPMQTAMIMFGLGGPMVAILLGMEGEAITECARDAGGEVVSIYFGVFNFIVKSLNGVATLIVGTLITLNKDPEWGIEAVRAMSLSAGGLLAIGVGLYFVILPRSTKALEAPPASA